MSNQPSPASSSTSRVALALALLGFVHQFWGDWNTSQANGIAKRAQANALYAVDQGTKQARQIAFTSQKVVKVGVKAEENKKRIEIDEVPIR